MCETFDSYLIAGTNYVAVLGSYPPAVIGKLSSNRITGLAEDDLKYRRKQQWKIDNWTWTK